jgi:ABC transporter substrate binding protein (PQQ-dependent alcohol dehydrogenase system)
MRDNETTGRITRQVFKLVEESVAPGEDPLPAFERLVADGSSVLVLDLPGDALVRVADAAKGRDLLLFNAGAPDDRLRGADCRDNLLHVAPSRAMLTDALAQYLVWKRWRRWFLITGRSERDRLYADALRRSAHKFGARIVADKKWEFGADARRTAQAEVPVFTQGAEHDVVVVADEPGEFGDLIPYRTWEARPVAGTQGLTASAWHATQEQWGATQFQNRFQRLAGRPMRALDYSMWAAVRAVGEAATRTRSTELEAIRAYLRSPAFELAAFKGVPLTFREWDWQLRQPITLSHPASLVSVSPQAGFLHQRTPLDTLGADRPESACPLSTRSPP